MNSLGVFQAALLSGGSENVFFERSNKSREKKLNMANRQHAFPCFCGVQADKKNAAMEKKRPKWEV
jgi:hypothetical protein